MFLSKRKTILVFSISVLVFFLTYTDIKSQDIKITDGDTIKINGKKIRFSGIDLSLIHISSPRDYPGSRMPSSA